MKNEFDSDFLAIEMGKALEKNKEMFSQASMFQKLAFANEFGCECGKCSKEGTCECKCHLKADKSDANDSHVDEEKDSAEANDESFDISDAVDNLLEVSAKLDTMGFERFAALTLRLTDSLISEAKAKAKKSKDSKKSDKDKAKEKASKEKEKASKEKEKEKEKASKEKEKAKASKDSKKSGK